MKRFAAFPLFLLVWMGLTWSLHWQDLLAGVLVSLVVCLLVGRFVALSVLPMLSPRRIFWTLVYLPFFFYHCVRANLDVAYRVLHPDTPIRPGFIRVETTLPSRAARVILASSITLTPGTLAVDLVDSSLYIHWINVRGKTHADYHRAVVAPFERILKEIFR
ncbi:Na+/H+ antiporter subunit E [bacterium]|nr:Na+/H+ antiporter subunit E [bacterium]